MLFFFNSCIDFIMKRFLLLLILLLPIDVFASVILIDADTNRVLYGSGEEEN